MKPGKIQWKNMLKEQFYHNKKPILLQKYSIFFIGYITPTNLLNTPHNTLHTSQSYPQISSKPSPKYCWFWLFLFVYPMISEFDALKIWSFTTEAWMRKVGHSGLGHHIHILRLRTHKVNHKRENKHIKNWDPWSNRVLIGLKRSARLVGKFLHQYPLKRTP